MTHRRTKKLGEILVAQGLISNDQLNEALQQHKNSGMALDEVLVNLKYVAEDALKSVVGDQIRISDQRKHIGEVLVEQGLITGAQLKLGLEEQKKTGLQFGKCIINLGFVSENTLADILAANLDIQHVILENFNFDRTLINLIPEEMARQYHVIPLFEKDGALTVAMADPTNLRTIDHLKFKICKDIEPVIAAERSIIVSIDANYSSGMEQMSELLGSVQVDELDVVKHDEDDETDRLTDEEGKQIVKLVNLIITQAVNEDASDIHIEPMDRHVRLRYRIDGELEERNPIPLQLRAQISSRLKIMAAMDIAEKRRPQDGHIEIRHKGRNIDLRVSTFPVMTRTRGVNEKIVMRIIDQGARQLTLDHLGFLPGMLKQFDDIVRQPDGIVLVTGPTGSGKSSTLYASLSRVNLFYESKKNIVTMEDPVEFVLEGINQGQINVKAGFNFDDGMRSILRQDPDIVMVGEMRDKQTCEMAIQAALTGHMVYSTLHTNDSASAFTRLIDMGLEPFLICSTIRGVLAQRLVRRVCSKCREPYHEDPDILKKLGLPPGISLYKGKGCRYCNNTGYKGRSGIFELLIPDSSVKKMVLERRTSDDIKNYCVSSGSFDTLRVDGLRKVVEGITTLEQVLGVTQND